MSTSSDAKTVRPATSADERALAVIDHRTWSWAATPVPLWSVERPFFDAGTRPEDVLVALVGERIAGYVKLRVVALAASGHLQEIHGFAVDPDQQGRGSAGRSWRRPGVRPWRAVPGASPCGCSAPTSAPSPSTWPTGTWRWTAGGRRGAWCARRR